MSKAKTQLCNAEYRCYIQYVTMTSQWTQCQPFTHWRQMFKAIMNTTSRRHWREWGCKLKFNIHYICFLVLYDNNYRIPPFVLDNAAPMYYKTALLSKDRAGEQAHVSRHQRISNQNLLNFHIFLQHFLKQALQKHFYTSNLPMYGFVQFWQKSF